MPGKGNKPAATKPAASTKPPVVPPEPGDDDEAQNTPPGTDDGQQGGSAPAQDEDGYTRVKTSDLNAVLDRMENMENEVNILRSATNKNKLADADQKAGKGVDKRPRMHLKRVNGKLVFGWKGRDESEVVRRNKVDVRMGEIMKMHIMLFDTNENGQQVEEVIDMTELSSSKDLVFFRALSKPFEVTDPKDEEKTILMVKGEFEDPELRKEYGTFEIPLIFVNP